MNKKILVGMSGGVDSSVALYLLKKSGFTPIGLYLDMANGNDVSPIPVTDSDTAENDSLASALQCAEKNGIKLYKLGCRDAFDSHVICNFANEYLSGRTPNPCTVCNRHVKVQKLIEAADMLGCASVATGHYAKIGVTESGRFYISKGSDPQKDQSYMLWKLTQYQLSRLMFPLGNMEKSEIYSIAGENSYVSASMKESLDICFLPEDVSYSQYIEDRFGKCPEGDFISPDGKVCGKHRGIIHYTVGQRKGLGVALGEPVFVLKIDKSENRIYLGRKSDEGGSIFTASDVNFIKQTECESFKGTFDVKVRYAASPVKALVEFSDGKLKVTSLEKIRAITPGQSVVVYDGDDIILGAVID